MTLLAKPIVKNQLWVVTDGATKVGNVQATDGGFEVKLGEVKTFFDSKDSIEKVIRISFERPVPARKKLDLPYAVWPTTGNTYNNTYDVQRKIHIYTKTPKSKCYYAAGFFKIKSGEEWETVFCPKYIFLQRYEFLGPFKTLDEDATV
jgi:hypothetical protein